MDKSNIWRGVFSALLALALCSCASSEKGNVSVSTVNSPYDTVSNQIAAKMSFASFNSWTDSDKKQNLANLVTQSGSACNATFATTAKNTQKMVQEEVVACVYTCIYKSLPSDFPTRENYKDDAVKHYNTSLELGSKILAPTF